MGAGAGDLRRCSGLLLRLVVPLNARSPVIYPKGQWAGAACLCAGPVRSGCRWCGRLAWWLAFPDPGTPVPSCAEVLLCYQGYFRSRLVSKLQALPVNGLRCSRLPSGWPPPELLEYLANGQLCWLEWLRQARCRRG